MSVIFKATGFKEDYNIAMPKMLFTQPTAMEYTRFETSIKRGDADEVNRMLKSISRQPILYPLN